MGVCGASMFSLSGGVFAVFRGWGRFFGVRVGVFHFCGNVYLCLGYFRLVFFIEESG